MEPFHFHATIEAREKDGKSDADRNLLVAVAKGDSVSGTGDRFPSYVTQEWGGLDHGFFIDYFTT